jgi:uncharacterized protein YlxW (UPF0749 family)
VNGTVIGALATGVLLFISSLLVPVIAKRLNKATDAADSASKIAAAAGQSSTMALTIAQEFKQQLDSTRQQCTECTVKLTALEKQIREERKQDRIERDAMYTAMAEVVPLLHADAAQLTGLRAAMATARRVRFDD